MTRVRILTVVGTRPEAIKLAPLIQRLQAHPDVDHLLCATGQHQEMLAQALKAFGLTPDENLGLMQDQPDLNQLTAGTLTGIGELIRTTHPDRVVVQGDTTTAFAAGLAAFHVQVPLAHVEAGLRTGQRHSPWPEEIYRRTLSLLADEHFAPTPWAAAQLRREGIAEAAIHITGNTVIDALQWVCGRTDLDALLERELGPELCAKLAQGRRLILVTGHRRENLDHGLAATCAALRQLAARGDVDIVFPVHLNPRVRETVATLLAGTSHIHLIEPLDYLGFVALMRRCHHIITDSGGIQEEAPGLGKPVLVTRDTTERPEAIEAGTALLIGQHTEPLVAASNQLLDNPAAFAAMAQARHPFGDGRASERIVAVLLQAGARR
ncbi:MULTISPECIES: non-hydrolyzing UDP-N-acetylglucosamine 2-epimerase [unclassified Roseateles]|uniref:non-hydrolyzing UDP-N-acetylglucosamine 2-epimerase n=1 Tax=unclassified Roseateles TaxID=2626991 RepID=UPI0006FAC763|nr:MULTISPECIES: UDP-N-acetylglucosamine 2-epimerase (non-hydrolyzing) [unclassified Roseateles]KQW42084.1 UDP-N-acetyl glucosamine 2-epimerase [Pelomonas sp. Root405]KRA67687.1 UDP-N-acetyl glucosamine 2-epimerase [Pelomonas sp. Root662]